MMENLIKMDDLGVPLFLETPILVLGGCTVYMLVEYAHKPSFATTGKEKQPKLYMS